jgi:hypothetical protein
MNLGTIIDRAQELADRKDTTWDGRCTRWANEAIRRWAHRLPWPTLRQFQDFTFNSREATGRILTLPQYVDKVLRIADDTNNRVLRPGGSPDLDFPNQHLDNTAGPADFFREIGITALHDQPDSAAQIQVQSTVSDVVSVYVAGVALDTAASGTPDELYQVHEIVAIGGSDVNTSTNLFVRVDTIGKTVDESLGDVLISTSADGQLGRLYQDDFQTKYRQLELTPAPTDGTVFQVEYLLKPQKLRNASDLPPPAVDIDFIIWYVAHMIQRTQGNVQEAEVFLANAEQKILESDATFEKNAGDQDYRAFPESLYWNNESQYTWPEN